MTKQPPSKPHPSAGSRPDPTGAAAAGDAGVTETAIGVARRYWATGLVRGALFLGVGLAMFLWTGIALDLVKWLLAIMLVLHGLLLALDYYRLMHSPKLEDEPGVWRLALAVAAVLAGIAILIWPDITVVLFLRIVAIWALVSGTIGVVSASKAMRKRRIAWDWEMAAAALWIAFGVLVLIKPLDDLPVVVVGLSVYLITSGLVLLVAGWSAKVATADAKQARATKVAKAASAMQPTEPPTPPHGRPPVAGFGYPPPPRPGYPPQRGFDYPPPPGPAGPGSGPSPQPAAPDYPPPPGTWPAPPGYREPPPRA